ncbi:hypothetical protein [Acidithiobacillus ferrooxidans]|uniref:hypothetical protein n=1 Tax=Acidithiobacillus ferrooxidans TaxID=920 RepID=UPI000A9C87FC|nr:hypothetical protein [Acidithiobacillus ferrooxidans]
MDKKFAIYSLSEAAIHDGNGYWSNEFGWTNEEQATLFALYEVVDRGLPNSTGQDARWVEIQSPTTRVVADASDKPLIEILTELKNRGLTQADVLSVYGVPRDENPYASYLQRHLGNDTEMELDDNVLLSETDDGCWVSCWRYVDDETVGINRHALTMVVDLDERGSFKAHVENYTGDSIFEFSNEDEHGNPNDDGVWPVTAGYMRHNRDTRGLLSYLREIVGLATEKNTLTVSG